MKKNKSIFFSLILILFISKICISQKKKNYFKCSNTSIISKNNLTVSISPVLGIAKAIGYNKVDSLATSRYIIGISSTIGYFVSNKIQMKLGYGYAYTFDKVFKPIYNKAYSISSSYFIWDKKVNPFINAGFEHRTIKYFPTEYYSFYKDEIKYQWNKRNINSLNVGLGGMVKMGKFDFSLSLNRVLLIDDVFSDIFKNNFYSGGFTYHFKLKK